MATEQQGGGTVTATSTKNNGGAGINLGNSSILDNRQSSNFFNNNAVFASTPLDDASADEARSAGVFAFDNDRGVIRRVTTTLSNVANTVLESAAAQPQNVQSVHSTTGIVIDNLTSSIRDGHWNAFSGAFKSATTTGLAAIDDSFGADNEASVSRSSQGEFAYRLGSGIVQDQYDPKNG